MMDLKELQQRLRRARAAAGLDWDTLRKLARGLSRERLFELITFEARGLQGSWDVYELAGFVRQLETLAGRRLTEQVEFSKPAPSRYERVLEAWRRGDYKTAQTLLNGLE